MTPVAQHHDPVGQRHRLDLVVGDVDHRRAEPAVQLVDLDPHLHAQLGVEVGERLVEEEDPRLAHDGAADRDALALAAGELAGLAVEELARSAGSRRRRATRARSPACGAPIVSRPKERFLRTRHVRVERVGLEHHGEPALGGRHLVHALAVDQDVAVGDLLEPGDHPEQRRLAAAGGADEDDELAVARR